VDLAHSNRQHNCWPGGMVSDAVTGNFLILNVDS